MMNVQIGLDPIKVFKREGISNGALECSSKAPVASNLSPQTANPADPLIFIGKLE